MASTAPTLVQGKWTLQVDPDDEVNYVADVTQWLIDNATTAASFELIPVGIEVLLKGTPQGDRSGLLPAKLKFTSDSLSTRYCTWRVTTADGQRFDKTMHFVEVQN